MIVGIQKIFYTDITWETLRESIKELTISSDDGKMVLINWCLQIVHVLFPWFVTIWFMLLLHCKLIQKYVVPKPSQGSPAYGMIGFSIFYFEVRLKKWKIGIDFRPFEILTTIPTTAGFAFHRKLDRTTSKRSLREDRTKPVYGSITGLFLLFLVIMCYHPFPCVKTVPNNAADSVTFYTDAPGLSSTEEDTVPNYIIVKHVLDTPRSMGRLLIG